MERINKILKNELFKKTLRNIMKAEETRIYCGHDIGHLFDTARICYILNLEQKTGFNKEIIYAAALLHDIGRYEEYENNIPHNEASAEIAEIILNESEFSVNEINIIKKAILYHRKDTEETSLGRLLYKSDKMSRKCFCCNVQNKCYWSIDKKNIEMKY